MKLKFKLRIFIIAFIIVAIVLSAMYLMSEGKKVEVKNFVRAYNNLITKAHLELNAGLIRNMTSDWQYKKVDSYIASNLKKGRIIKGELTELIFKDVKVENDLATVITTERWLWSYVDPATKQPISEIFDEMYGITYHLNKVQSRWFVDDIDNEFIGKAAE